MKSFKSFYIAQSPQSSPPSTDGTRGMFDSGWVPLFQTLAWILFWAILIRFIYRNFNLQLGGLLSAIVNRVQQGSPIEAGTFKLGVPSAVANQQVNSATSEGTQGASLSEDLSEEVLNCQQYPTGIAEEVYLLHAAEIVSPRTENRKGSYQVKVWLEADTDTDFNECEQVVYRLHESFNQRVIATEAKNNQFELWLNVWGEFTIIAYVKRKNKEPLWLTRYLDLPGRPSD
jgi:YEATS family